MEENKKRNILLVVAIVTVLLTIIGAAYAYYSASIGDATTRDVEATTGTTDSLTFKTEDEININASILNFGPGQTSLRDSAKAIATLKAGTESTPSMNYYVYMVIDKNEFTYTTEEKTPELLLKVTGPNGVVTSIPGLKYVTATVDGVQESGFDITEHQGLDKIADNYNIATDSEKIDEWNIEVVYINLNSNQNDHLNKNINGKLIIQGNKLTLAEACKGSKMAECIAQNYDLDSTIIFHDIDGAKQGATLISDNSNLSAQDKSYRYTGASNIVNNYVCFGSAAETCPPNNLYRIIGVFPTDETLETYEVKLIKNTSIGNYYWSGSSSNHSNIWENSTLRTDVLNDEAGEYWQSLGTDASKVVVHDWIVSGGPHSGMYTDSNVQITYNYEVASTCSTCVGKQPHITLPNKVGLMYVSDYMYAADTSEWNVAGSSYSTDSANCWIYISDTEWTISRASDGDNGTFDIYKRGHGAGFLYVNTSYSTNAIRPTIYLNSTTEFFSGTGTSTDPYRIK